VFILIHKIDQIKDSEKISTFENKKREITDESEGLVLLKEFFATSIWDETLYKAWSKIV
jgi:Ras-related GTP-binding protein A/B